MRHLIKILVMLLVCCISSLALAADKPANKTKEEQELNQKGYKLVNSISCDLNRDGRPEKAMLFKNTKKNLGVIAVLDNGKFIQLGTIGDSERVVNWGKLEGCKAHSNNYGPAPKESFGVSVDIGDNFTYMGIYYKWNGQKYKQMSPPDFMN